MISRPFALLAAVCLVGCASPDEAEGRRYRVVWNAARVGDQSPLAASSASLRVGGTAKVKTGQARPTEQRPAVTGFEASLQRGAKPGLVEVTSRATVVELVKTPKGKLKRRKRTIGALLPMRAGERQLTSSSDDPVAVTLQLERASGH